MTNSRDIARLAGVSQATVSRVLRDQKNVRPETREKILSVIREAGYRPNAHARALKSNRSNNVGVVVGRITNPLYPVLLETLGAQLVASGFQMIVWEAEVGGEEAALNALFQSVIDGLILTTATSLTSPLQQAVEQNAPIVLVHRVLDGVDCPQIASDNFGGAREVAHYFARNGFTRNALIAGPDGPSTLRGREQGYVAGLKESGQSLSPSLLVRVPWISHQTGFEAMTRLLEMGQLPEAVFCANDLLAFGAIGALRKSGMVPGKDIWIVGYDDVEMASWPALDLTTVRQPLDALVREGVRSLMARFSGEDFENERMLLPNDLIIRGSTGRKDRVNGGRES